jgi:hypothetical protein
MGIVPLVPRRPKLQGNSTGSRKEEIYVRRERSPQSTIREGRQARKRSALLPSGRERVTEGQQFHEIERQQKNPDGSPRAKDEWLLRF